MILSRKPLVHPRSSDRSRDREGAVEKQVGV
jgi:hypothetical protein